MESSGTAPLVAAIRTVLHDVEGRLRHAHGRDRVVLLGLRNALQEHLLSVSADEALVHQRRHSSRPAGPGPG